MAKGPTNEDLPIGDDAFQDMFAEQPAEQSLHAQVPDQSEAPAPVHIKAGGIELSDIEEPLGFAVRPAEAPAPEPVQTEAPEPPEPVVEAEQPHEEQPQPEQEQSSLDQPEQAQPEAQAPDAPEAPAPTDQAGQEEQASEQSPESDKPELKPITIAGKPTIFEEVYNTNPEFFETVPVSYFMKVVERIKALDQRVVDLDGFHTKLDQIVSVLDTKIQNRDRAFALPPEKIAPPIARNLAEEKDRQVELEAAMRQELKEIEDRGFDLSPRETIKAYQDFIKKYQNEIVSTKAAALQEREAMLDKYKYNNGSLDETEAEQFGIAA